MATVCSRTILEGGRRTSPTVLLLPRSFFGGIFTKLVSYGFTSSAPSGPPPEFCCFRELLGESSDFGKFQRAEFFESSRGIIKVPEVETRLLASF